MIKWKRYNRLDDKVEQPIKNTRYLVYTPIGAEVAIFSHWGDWKIFNNDVIGVTHYAEINTPDDLE